MSKSLKSSKSPKSTIGAIKFVFPACRPSAGSALASYTAAWLSLSGMDDGRAVPAKMVRQLAGDTAFSYHTRKGNFEKTDGGVKLTEQGFFHFGNLRPEADSPNRNIRPEPELIKAYADVMSTGKTNDAVKNPAFIKAIS